MVLSKGVKKCFGLLLVCFIMFGVSLGVYSEDVNASTHYTSANVDFYAGQQIESTVSLPWSVNPSTHRFFLNNVYFNEHDYDDLKLAYISGRMVMEVNPKTATDFFVCGRDASYSWGIAASSYCLGSLTVVYTDNSHTIQDDIPVYLNEIRSPFTYNIYFDFSKELEASKVIDFIQFRFYAASGFDVISRTTNWNNTTLMVLVEGRSSISVYETPPSGVDIANDLLQQQVAQNQYLIDKETEAENNISNQSPSDIQGAENQQTSNIIGVITRFFGQLGNISSQSCNLTLPFPQYAGGTVTVTPCNGKQYLPDHGLIITIAASLFLVGFTIPLCFILLKMIYNEIRSWTNG